MIGGVGLYWPRYGIHGSLMQSMNSRSFSRLLLSENKSAIFSYVDRSRFDNSYKQRGKHKADHIEALNSLEDMLNISSRNRQRSWNTSTNKKTWLSYCQCWCYSRLTAQVLVSLKTGALWRADSTAMTACRFWRSNSFYKHNKHTRWHHCLLRSTTILIDTTESVYMYSIWSLLALALTHLGDLNEVCQHLGSRLHTGRTQNLLLHPEVHLYQAQNTRYYNAYM